MNNNLYIVWGENNQLGITIIDEQHRGIISSINSLYYFIETGHGSEIAKPTMVILEQYIDIHFKTEEALMAEAGYPAFEEHVGLHKELAKKTKSISMDINRDMDSDVVLKFLKDWWLGHINKEDRKYAPYLKKLLDT